ncbi:MAG: PH domain-containing protein [Patescibacteria group bacterium]
MVSEQSIHAQLKTLGFKTFGWGRSEVGELPNILLPDEEIFECVNGVYEGGFALLLATDVRVLLVDKKPLNYLTVEDLRFDMINEIDYNHRLLGAYITIATGNKYLKFQSLNQPRLRKLIGHVQHAMAEAKKKQSTRQEGQNQHLEQINQQLQTYLLAQYQQQQRLHEQLDGFQAGKGTNATLSTTIEPPVKPSPELADYLYAQGLMAQHEARTGGSSNASQAQQTAVLSVPKLVPYEPRRDELADLYSEGMQEIFGKHGQGQRAVDAETVQESATAGHFKPHAHISLHSPLEINPMRVAYSKLPMALRNRRFGRPPLPVFQANDSETEVA